MGLRGAGVFVFTMYPLWLFRHLRALHLGEIRERILGITRRTISSNSARNIHRLTVAD
jgi:hypothetical protein